MASYPKRLDKDELNELPILKVPARIDLVETADHMDKAVAKLKQQPALGFDTETRPSFKKGVKHPVALLQLATPDHVWLFRMSKLRLSHGLVSIFGNPGIVKAGVAIADDIKALQENTDFEPRGFVELAQEAKEKGFENFGLRGLTGIFLGERLSKAAKLTNWERADLTPKQIHYAAADAWAGLHIYLRLQEVF